MKLFLENSAARILDSDDAVMAKGTEDVAVGRCFVMISARRNGRVMP
jgi:hypothetical protein